MDRLRSIARFIVTVPGVHSPDIKRKLGPNKLKQRSIVPLFRRSFIADKAIAGATIYITGLGQYELNINGEKVGNSFFIARLDEL